MVIPTRLLARSSFRRQQVLQVGHLTTQKSSELTSRVQLFHCPLHPPGPAGEDGGSGEGEAP